VLALININRCQKPTSHGLLFKLHMKRSQMDECVDFDVAYLKLFRTARISFMPLKKYSYGNGKLVHDLYTDLTQPF
jgi:hypothetical protein